MFKEFKSFIAKGNIMDLAIGIIIGQSFQKIVTSLVNDIIMPGISIFTGKVDYSSMGFTVGDVTVKYGSFITTIVDFLIIAISIFIAIKSITNINKHMEKATRKQLEKLSKNKKIGKFKKKEETILEPTLKDCPYCFSEINIKATKCPHCTSDIEKK